MSDSTDRQSKRYFIVRLTDALWLESYMGSHVTATTDKQRVFKFNNESDAKEVAQRYGGECRPQRIWN